MRVSFRSLSDPLCRATRWCSPALTSDFTLREHVFVFYSGFPQKVGCTLNLDLGVCVCGCGCVWVGVGGCVGVSCGRDWGVSRVSRDGATPDFIEITSTRACSLSSSSSFPLHLSLSLSPSFPASLCAASPPPKTWSFHPCSLHTPHTCKHLRISISIFPSTSSASSTSCFAAMMSSLADSVPDTVSQ